MSHAAETKLKGSTMAPSDDGSVGTITSSLGQYGSLLEQFNDGLQKVELRALQITLQIRPMPLLVSLQETCFGMFGWLNSVASELVVSWQIRVHLEP
jgi:hypothetical protein